MKLPLLHFVAIVLVGCAIGAVFQLIYPEVEIDAELALLIALIAVAVESLAVFIYRRIVRQG